jgi:hypothetical protein
LGFDGIQPFPKDIDRNTSRIQLHSVRDTYAIEQITEGGIHIEIHNAAFKKAAITRRKTLWNERHAYCELSGGRANGNANQPIKEDTCIYWKFRWQQYTIWPVYEATA